MEETFFIHFFIIFIFFVNLQHLSQLIKAWQGKNLMKFVILSLTNRVAVWNLIFIINYQLMVQDVTSSPFIVIRQIQNGFR